MIFFVRIVWQVVVFEAVDPAIVVQVDAEEELGAVRTVAQERFVVVGEEVGPLTVAVLVEIGDEIAVLIVSGKDRRVGHALLADRERRLTWDRDQAALIETNLVWMAVVIVVVIDKVVQTVRGFG